MAARKTPAKKTPAPSEVVEKVDEVPQEVEAKSNAAPKLVDFITVTSQSAAFKVNGVGKIWNPRIRRADNRLVFRIPEDELEAFCAHHYVKNGIIVRVDKG